MSTPALFETPDSPPPPAYDFSQQEFDRKTSHALEVSQSDPPPRRTVEDEEGVWEAWDDAAFDAALARLNLSDGSSSSSAVATSSAAAWGPGTSSTDAAGSASIAPLQVVKKSAKHKERPSWYDEAQLDKPASKPPPALQGRTRDVLPRSSSISNRVDQEREPTPPPMFEAVGPSLDGPPYEGSPYEGVVMTYAPDSRSPSPLSPSISAPQMYHPSRLSEPPRMHAPSFQEVYNRRPSSHSGHPQAAPLPAIPPPRPTSAVQRAQPPLVQPKHFNSRPPAANGLNNFAGPRLAFNPQMAYAGRPLMDSSEGSMPQKVDASAFYNSAVSAHVPSSLTPGARRNLPHSSTYYSQPPNAQASQPLMQPGYNPNTYSAVNREHLRSPAPSMESYQPYGQPPPQQYAYSDSRMNTNSLPPRWGASEPPGTGEYQAHQRPW